MTTGTATTGGGGGEGGAQWATSTAKKLDREEVGVDETDFFVGSIYIGGVFSASWSHQPVIKANFRQAKGRETAPLVPVRATNRY